MASEKKASLEQSDAWEEYRAMSMSPGGFGEKRADIWSKILHAEPQHVKEEGPTDDESSSHPDERQIRLDTERSFVLYPVDSKTDKDKLQSELNHLLVEIFRKRPKLNYFQGYHDIITVLLLTLPRELQLPCAEQLSLQRVRDSMGSTLEPVLGLLRVMKNLLRVADPRYAELLERTSPLPYYALPNLLTLFSHDMPTLPLIQRVFDYLLCRPPIYVVYLASAIILSRKPEVERLEEEGEEGMMHSILSALPEIVDDNSPAEEAQAKEESPSDDFLAEAKEESPSQDVPDIKQEPSHQANVPDIKEEPSDGLSEAHGGKIAAENNADLPIDEKASVETTPETETETELPSPPNVSDDDSDEVPSNRRKAWKSKPHTLTDILNMSDALYKAHPPASPPLQLSSIMGPQSVVFTWSTRLSDMPSSDVAERMVERLDLIVYPEPPPVVEPKDRDTKIRRRKQFQRRAGTGTVGLLVGAGLVLGVAVAISVYSARQGGDPALDWRKLGRWVGGVLAGASEKVIRHRA
ncbi:TBC1 domain member 20 [Mycena venus]|uniref:TBC1 domain member 20 n=1 Tax=Mycena venus TaxID=2733690 RepID=A0A8H6YCL7_9AGAR|nr:TBC1 domain member 20 [Mycena venus]